MGMVLPGDYSGYMIFFFENGKAAKVELSAYKTTSNRRRLTGAYSDKSHSKRCCISRKTAKSPSIRQSRAC